MRLLRQIVGIRLLVSLAGSVVAFSSVPLLTVPGLPAASGRDRFEGRLLLEPVDGPGMVMRLGDEFAYVDPAGKRWVAPAGLETDGASIPRVLYSVVGPPFDGSYLKAAVIHDAASPSDVDSWQDAHRMFYYALLRCGVGEAKAKVMYAAVYHFGPRWATPGQPAPYANNIVAERLAKSAGRPAELRYDRERQAIDAVGPEAPPTEQVDAVERELFDQCRRWVEREHPSLAEIEDWTGGMSEAIDQ
ncbi:MAG: DUF1353 domain-containing protein [Planctomycetaceae bacterium]